MHAVVFDRHGGCGDLPTQTVEPWFRVVGGRQVGKVRSACASSLGGASGTTGLPLFAQLFHLPELSGACEVSFPAEEQAAVELGKPATGGPKLDSAGMY